MLPLDLTMKDMSLFFESICCVYVISRVISQEDIFEPWRNFLMEDEQYFFYGLFSCFFCLSCWVSLITSLFAHINPCVLIVGSNILKTIIEDHR